MLPDDHPDRIQIAFDDHRLVANAGLILPTTLARHLGLPQLVDQRLDLGNAPGRANTGDKIMTLVASALAGGDCIDDADVLRTGGTAHPRVVAPASHSAPVATHSVATIAHLAFSLAGTILIPDCTPPQRLSPAFFPQLSTVLFTVAGVVGPDLPHGELPPLQLTTQPFLHRLCT